MMKIMDIRLIYFTVPEFITNGMRCLYLEIDGDIPEGVGRLGGNGGKLFGYDILYWEDSPDISGSNMVHKIILNCRTIDEFLKAFNRYWNLKAFW